MIISQTLPVVRKDDDGGDDKRNRRAKEKRLLGRLAKLWQSECQNGLVRRHQMGALLNQELGPPSQRLASGQRILKLAAEHLTISESELSRMRWFAHLFPTVADLRETHPGITCWMLFKQKLPHLKPLKGNRAEVPAANTTDRAVRGVSKTLHNALATLRRLGDQLQGSSRDDVLAVLRELVEVMKMPLPSTIPSPEG